MFLSAITPQRANNEHGQYASYWQQEVSSVPQSSFDLHWNLLCAVNPWYKSFEHVVTDYLSCGTLEVTKNSQWAQCPKHMKLQKHVKPFAFDQEAVAAARPDSLRGARAHFVLLLKCWKKKKKNTNDVLPSCVLSRLGLGLFISSKEMKGNASPQTYLLLLKQKNCWSCVSIVTVSAII